MPPIRNKTLFLFQCCRLSDWDGDADSLHSIRDYSPSLAAEQFASRECEEEPSLLRRYADGEDVLVICHPSSARVLIRVSVQREPRFLSRKSPTPLPRELETAR